MGLCASDPIRLEGGHGPAARSNGASNGKSNGGHPLESRMGSDPMLSMI